MVQTDIRYGQNGSPENPLRFCLEAFSADAHQLGHEGIDPELCSQPDEQFPFKKRRQSWPHNFPFLPVREDDHGF
jgi:hypothetical protein